MMGGQSSNKKGVKPLPLPLPPPPQQLLHLISYEEACWLDPDLQSFHSTLRERTNRVFSSLSTGIHVRSLSHSHLISYEEACRPDPDLQSFDSTLRKRTLSTGIEVRSLGFDSLNEVTNCLVDMNQDVVNVILQSKEDIRKNKKLFSLVEEYFESSAKTLDFCAVLESFLERARNSKIIIHFALRKFKEEVALYDGVDEMNFKKTLEQLGKFEGAGDPFSEVFFLLFQSVYRQQVSMLEKLEVQKKKLDSLLWNNYVLKVQNELVSSMHIGTFIAIKDMDNILVLVNKLKDYFDSLLQKVDIALINKDALKIVIEDIKKNMQLFMETIECLGEQASGCGRSITRARAFILHRINCYPDGPGR